MCRLPGTHGDRAFARVIADQAGPQDVGTGGNAPHDKAACRVGQRHGGGVRSADDRDGDPGTRCATSTVGRTSRDDACGTGTSGAGGLSAPGGRHNERHQHNHCRRHQQGRHRSAARNPVTDWKAQAWTRRGGRNERNAPLPVAPAGLDVTTQTGVVPSLRLHNCTSGSRRDRWRRFSRSVLTPARQADTTAARRAEGLAALTLSGSPPILARSFAARSYDSPAQ